MSNNGRNREELLRRDDSKAAQATIMAAGKPDTLTRAELRLWEQPVTRDPQPKRATAWVRYGEHRLHVRCRVVVWTTDAVGIEWLITPDPAGPRHKTWVWRGAVRDPDPASDAIGEWAPEVTPGRSGPARLP